MDRTRYHRWTASLLCAVWLSSQALAAEDPPHYREAHTGLLFPTMIGKLERTKVVDYEPRHPGLGVSVRYAIDRDCYGDVYVYNLGYRAIPSDPRSALVAGQFAQALEDIREAERQGVYQGVRLGERGVTRLAGGGSPEVQHAALVYQQEGHTRYSHLYLTAFRNHYVKIRFTAGREKDAECDTARTGLLHRLSTAMAQASAP